MRRNRFERVDEPQPDAITLHLLKTDGGDVARVHCPAVLTQGGLAQDQTSRDMPLIEGFRSALRLANEIKAPLVVLDPQSLWLAEWGDLYTVE